MEFCPKCGAVLVQKRKNSGCPRCNYSSKTKSILASSEKLGKKGEIDVVKEESVEVLPMVNEKCKKCKNEKAYFWTIQTRSGDEAETKFFKCMKCEHTWREYN